MCIFSSPEHVNNCLQNTSSETTRVKLNETSREASLVTLYKNATNPSRLNNLLFAFKKYLLMKLYRKLHCMSVYKNTRRHQDWQTTTKWWTSIFALKNFFYKNNIKDTTMTDTRKLHGKLPFVTLYKDTTKQLIEQQQQNGQLSGLLSKLLLWNYQA